MDNNHQRSFNLTEEIVKLAEQGVTVPIVVKELGQTRANAFALLKKLTAQRWLYVEGGEEPSSASIYWAQRQDNYMAHDPFGLGARVRVAEEDKHD
jgi:hypothetical protein